MILIKIFILVIFIGVLYLLGVYSPILKKYTGKMMNASSEVVAGASIVDTSKLDGKVPALPNKIKTDINNSVENVKQTGLEITIGDIVSTAGRVGKIVQDIRNVQEFTKNKVEELLK